MASAINFTNDTLASRAYSRKLEIEADKLGLQVYQIRAMTGCH